jgi:peptidoglycan endopeptidase LytE
VRAEAGPTSVHVVQQGDTLLQIALDAGTDTGSLVTLNGLGDANVLTIGQALKLPARAGGAPAAQPTSAPQATSAPAAAASASSYTIASGDTLWDIAQHFNTTTDALVQLNHLDDADHLSVGTVLNVPAGAQPRAAASTNSGASNSATAASSSGGASSSAAPASATPGSAGPKRSLTVSYTVQSGETLNQIARQFSVRADAIVQATNLGNADKIGVGSVLKVPVAAKEHVVSDGETLRDIASSEKVDLGSLIDFNQIDDPALIRVGQVVLLPVAASKSSAASAAPASAAPANDTAPSAKPPTPAPAPAPAPPAQNQADTGGQTAAAVPAPNPQPAAAAPTPKPQASPSPAPKASPSLTPAPRPQPAAVAPPGAPSDGLATAGAKLLGDPYLWGGSTPSGFDCSGFVWYVARQLNKQVSRGMFGQYNSGSHPGREELKPGDLVFFQNTYHPGLSHNGIYLGNDQFVHAADEAAGVTVSSLNTAYWTAHWFGATRLP